MQRLRPALFLLALASGPTLAQEVGVTITPLRQQFGRSDDVQVRVTLTNISAAPQYVLKWHTPLEGVMAPLFDIQRDGLPVRYLGIKAKRAAPGPGDYLRLDPGASLDSTVELSALYEMHVTGAYTLRYRTGAAGLYATQTLRPVDGTLVSNPVSIWVEGRLPRSARPPARVAATGAALEFNKCSNAQQEQVTLAVDAGRAMTVEGHAYLGAGPNYGARYGTWFGASDAARGARVTSNFAAIRDAFENKPLKVDCGCNEPYFAYVYPAQPYTVYVCKAFWTAPLTGTDSRGGTLLHELSHFDVVAGTDDHVYGQLGAAEMALTSPKRAINNADSHEYFGENTPVLNARPR